MSCPQCHDLCVKYVIRVPDQLRKAIRVAAQAVEEGVLAEIETYSGLNQYTFTECAQKMIWGDMVDYHFRCNHCATRFELGAETYHGSGGYWAPESEPPREVID